MHNTDDELNAEQLAEENKQIKRLLVDVMNKQSRSEAMGRVFHDFNNMLSSTMGYASLALERVESIEDEKLPRYLNNIERASIRARDLVRECLAQRQQERNAAQPCCLAQELELLGLEVASESALEQSMLVSMSAQDVALLIRFLLTGNFATNLSKMLAGVKASLQSAAQDNCKQCDAELPPGALRLTVDWSAAEFVKNGGENNKLMDFSLVPAMVNMSGGHMCTQMSSNNCAEILFRTLSDEPT